jgi:rhodanese-related sulfurtransferase
MCSVFVTFALHSIFLHLPTMSDITPAELKQRQAAGETPIILDVREAWENEEGRIDGSQNIPLGTLPQKLEDLEHLKDQEIIVHCKGGGRSASAKTYLTQQGFTQVRNLVGGFQAYQQA